MRKLIWLLGAFFVISSQETFSQVARIDSIKFFTDDRPIEMTLTTDYRKLLNEKLKMAVQPATITLRFPDSSNYTGSVDINARGITRKESCIVPPIRLNFKHSSSDAMRSLHKLKMVCGCTNGSGDEQLALKEYLTYKIYNLITDLSFRVRLLHVTYNDSKGKAKTYSQYGFLIEDVDPLAKRNKCKETQKIAFATESTNRDQMTLVALFEYMIGNTDWSVPNYHNIKLITLKAEPNSLPIVIPYDFDYAGLVNAYYAVPAEELQLTSVTERAYRGFARSMEELEAAIKIFNDQKENIKNLIMNFEPLSSRSKKEMMAYLEEFYKTINNKNSVESTFIKGARTQ
ncbi:MAG: hypothetical protein JST17_11200 [Bacteroidetes bacterium]|nr:hypothetical protein [Bacteroidota bacterium]MBS1930212.1 hypothetical protein [Bacteroidota bacterium]